jgi:hypothetical protein
MAIPLWAMALMQGAGKGKETSSPTISDLTPEQSAQAAGVGNVPRQTTMPSTQTSSNRSKAISDALSSANYISPGSVALKAGGALKGLSDFKKRQRKFDRIAEIARENEASDRAYGLQQRSDRDATGDMQKVLALQEYLKSLNVRRV